MPVFQSCHRYLTGCMTLGKSLSSFKPQYSHPYNGGNKFLSLRGLYNTCRALSKCSENVRSNYYYYFYFWIFPPSGHCVQSGSSMVMCQGVIHSFSPLGPQCISALVLASRPSPLHAPLTSISMSDSQGLSDKAFKSTYMDAKKHVYGCQF